MYSATVLGESNLRLTSGTVKMTSSFHVKTQGIPDILMKFTEQIISKVLEEDEHQAIK